MKLSLDITPFTLDEDKILQWDTFYHSPLRHELPRVTKFINDILGQNNHCDVHKNKYLVFSDCEDQAKCSSELYYHQCYKNLNNRKVFLSNTHYFTSYSKLDNNKNTLVDGTVRDIYSNLEKPFLRAIKSDYPEFDIWFSKILEQNRKCYYFEKDSDIGALLIYNIETPQDHQLNHISDKALKLCTFKVSNEVKGYKLGESFIRESFKIAVRNNLEFIYLTVFPKHESLISLLTKHGFVNHSKNKNGELVYVRHLMSLPTAQNIDLFTSSNGCLNIY